MPIEAYLVCGGKYHDMDYARLELLKHLAEYEDVRTRVGEDYRDTEAVADADLLVTYTCDVRPSEAEQKVLAEFVSRGGRWFALHGTNAVLDFDGTPPFRTPRSHPVLMETLGSQFLGHPPIAPYTVTPCSDDPLVAGIEPFEAEDELYLCEYHPPLEPLLETRFIGKAPGFASAGFSWSGQASGGSDRCTGNPGDLDPRRLSQLHSRIPPDSDMRSATLTPISSLNASTPRFPTRIVSRMASYRTSSRCVRMRRLPTPAQES